MSRLQPRSTAVGFTLIELVITILIMGILTAIATPKFVGSVKRCQAQAACARIKADLMLARQKAIAGSTTQSVQFTPGSPVYSLPGLTDPDRPDQPYSVNLADSSYGAVVTSAAIGAGATVQFDRYGQPNSGGVITVSAGSASGAVSIDAASGMASIP